MGKVQIKGDLTKTGQTLATLTNQRIFYAPGVSFWKAYSDSRMGVGYPDQLAESLPNPYVNEAASEFDSRNPSWKLRNATADALTRKDNLFPTLLPYLGSNTAVDRPFLRNYFFEANQIYYRPADVANRWMESPTTQLNAFPQFSKKDIGSGMTAYTLPASKGLVYAASEIDSICSYSDLLSVQASKAAFVYATDPQLSQYVSESCTSSFDRELRDTTAKTSLASVSTLKHSPDLGWSPGYLSFYEGEAFSSQIEDFLYTRVADTVTLTVPLAPANTQPYLKYLVSPRGGSLSINGEVLNSFTSGAAQWRYARLHQVNSQERATIYSISGENAVEAIVYLHDSTKAKTAQRALGTSEISYTYQNPTTYRANIASATTEKKLLIVAENYNSNWKLVAGGKEYPSIMINTWSNGFLIDGSITGDVKIVYSQQPLFLTLLILSLLGWVASAGYSLQRFYQSKGNANSSHE
jgi:hypothetical protein